MFALFEGISNKLLVFFFLLLFSFPLLIHKNDDSHQCPVTIGVVAASKAAHLSCSRRKKALQ